MYAKILLFEKKCNLCKMKATLFEKKLLILLYSIISILLLFVKFI